MFIPFAFLNSSTASGFSASNFCATSMRETKIFRSSVWNCKKRSCENTRTGKKQAPLSVSMAVVSISATVWPLVQGAVHYIMHLLVQKDTARSTTDSTQLLKSTIMSLFKTMEEEKHCKHPNYVRLKPNCTSARSRKVFTEAFPRTNKTFKSITQNRVAFNH